MAKSKYIIIDRGIFEQVIFSETLNHNEIAIALNGNNKIIGAGFCHIEDDKYVCYGNSVSLQIKSRGQLDSDILNRRLGATYD